MEVLYCAIHFLLIYVKFINGTSVNSKTGSTVSANTFVNITRHYDGDIIFIKGKFLKKLFKLIFHHTS